VVWNTGGYERPETLRALEGKVDVYLPDLKYLRGDTAARYSDAPDYPQVATAAIREMVPQTGPVVLEDGLIKKGVIIRHLILPGQTAQAKEVMDWVAENFERGEVLFSLMSQYTPWGDLSGHPELDRRLRRGEMNSAIEYMQNLDLPGFCQERTSAKEEYTPPFDLTGL
jgi:putative pyruvate formate lyase activating enzyme